MVQFMAQIEKLRNDFKNADKSFYDKLAELASELQKHQQQETGRISLDDGYLDKQPSELALLYCLSESRTQLERCIAEKPSRELSLAKTKLQEAIFWVRES